MYNGKYLKSLSTSRFRIIILRLRNIFKKTSTLYIRFLLSSIAYMIDVKSNNTSSDDLVNFSKSALNSPEARENVVIGILLLSAYCIIISNSSSLLYVYTG